MQLRNTVAAAIVALVIPPTFAAEPLSSVTIENFVLEIDDGRAEQIQAGWLDAPEAWTGASQNRSLIRFYRFASTASTPAPPVFLLSGGPGGSSIKRAQQDWFFDEIAMYREVADVILFDQRGSGECVPNLRCTEAAPMDLSEGIVELAIFEAMRSGMERCRDHWIAEGVKLAEYNTDAIARDMDAIRKHLGHQQISVIGGSYGSHLGLHYLKKYPHCVYRAVFSGLEGPDDTYDIPSERLATLERIAARAEAAKELSGQIPEIGLIEALRQTLKRLEAEPAHVAVQRGSQQREALVTADLLRFFITRDAEDRSDAERWPLRIAAWYEGDYSSIAPAALGMTRIPPPNAMKCVVDLASGGSPERLAMIASDPADFFFIRTRVERNAAQAVWPAADLGAEFNAPTRSDVPTLILHGTWDLSTPIENARRVARELPNSQFVEIVHGRHSALYDLFNHWGNEFRSRLKLFLKGEPMRFPEQFIVDNITYNTE